MGAMMSSKKDYNPVLAKQLPRKPIIFPKIQSKQYPLATTLSIPSPIRSQPPTSQPIVVKQPAIVWQNEMSEAVILARSVHHLHNQQRTDQTQFFGTRPQSRIVEHNGKEFLTEFRTRIERRYVQVFDENLGRSRLFEVVDYIPSRTVRPIRHHRQPLIPPRRAPTTQSENRAKIFPSHQSSIQPDDREQEEMYESSNRSNTAERSPAGPYKENAPPKPEVYNRYSGESSLSQTQPLRQHTPTGSEYSSSSSESTEDSPNDADRVSMTENRYGRINQNNHRNSYVLVPGQSSAGMIDPFQKTQNLAEHHYGHRTGVNRYTEPIPNAAAYLPTRASDYAPIQLRNQQPNKSVASHHGSYYDSQYKY